MTPHSAPQDQWLPSQWAEWDHTEFLSGPQSGAGREVVFDNEGNGLFHPIPSRGIEKNTLFWCIAAVDVNTREFFYWGVDQDPDAIGHAIRFLAECNITVGHNATGYDYPAMEEIYPWYRRCPKAWDTLPIAKTIWPAESLLSADMALVHRGRLPAQLVKSHSLKAWGCRTGTHKKEYEGGFKEWCPAMAAYLMDDIRSGLALWLKCRERMGWDNPTPGQLVWPELTVETECQVARIIFDQIEFGVQFDMPRAVALAAHLANEQARVGSLLVETFGSWWQPLDDPDEGFVAGASVKRKQTDRPDITMPRYGKTGKLLAPYVGPPLEEICKGDRYVRIVRTEFNPSSRAHIAQRLQEVFGWKPKKFGKTTAKGVIGIPTVDETTLEEIPDSVMPATTRQQLLDYFVVSKTLATVKSWIAKCGAAPWLNDGRIHGRVDAQGTPTRRATHSQPNISGCPKVVMEKGEDGKEHPVKGLVGRYGWECRELFTADIGWELTGVDASSLELIDLGHYLWPYDKGAFSDRVCDPTRDAHREHAELMGGGTLRSEAKTTIYLKVYGGSAYKLSLALEVPPEKVTELLTYRGLPMLMSSLVKRFDQDFVDKLDDTQKARIAHARQIIIKLEAGIVGLKDLGVALQGDKQKGIVGAAEKGWLKAIDGSRIIVRKPHAALNSLLQSAGAISCKLWMCLLHKELAVRGLLSGRDFKQVIWAHDELQITHRPGLGPLIREAAQACMVQAGEMLGLRGQYRTDGKTGKTWAECH